MDHIHSYTHISYDLTCHGELIYLTSSELMVVTCIPDHFIVRKSQSGNLAVLGWITSEQFEKMSYNTGEALPYSVGLIKGLTGKELTQCLEHGLHITSETRISLQRMGDLQTSSRALYNLSGSQRSDARDQAQQFLNITLAHHVTLYPGLDAEAHLDLVAAAISQRRQLLSSRTEPEPTHK